MARIRIEDLPQTGAEDELSDKDLESVAGGGIRDDTALLTSSSSSTLYLGSTAYIPIGTIGSVFGPRG